MGQEPPTGRAVVAAWGRSGFRLVVLGCIPWASRLKGTGVSGAYYWTGNVNLSEGLQGTWPQRGSLTAVSEQRRGTVRQRTS